MNITKKSCVTQDCGGTCPGVDCIPVGEVVTVGVSCWHPADQRFNLTTTFNVTSVSDTNLTGKVQLSKQAFVKRKTYTCKPLGSKNLTDYYKWAWYL